MCQNAAGIQRTPWCVCARVRVCATRHIPQAHPPHHHHHHSEYNKNQIEQSKNISLLFAPQHPQSVSQQCVVSLVPQVGQRQDHSVPPGASPALIGQQQTLLFWLSRLSNASHEWRPHILGTIAKRNNKKMVWFWPESSPFRERWRTAFMVSRHAVYSPSRGSFCLLEPKSQLFDLH